MRASNDRCTLSVMPNITPYPSHQENSAARAGRCSTQQNSPHARTSRRNSRHLHALPSSAPHVQVYPYGSPGTQRRSGVMPCFFRWTKKETRSASLSRSLWN
ncbi:hypothetical protein FHG61_03930 [Xylella fastidiosa subsp. multiplex]|nr:hypothetical protein [Xylella fastidiosa subsp. multiplex]